MSRSRSILTGAAVVGLTLSVGLSACGSDSDSSTKDDKGSPSTTAAKADPAAGASEGFCTDYVAANLAINAMPGNMGGPDAPQPEPDELKTWYQENLASTIEKIKTEVPDEISGDMQAMLDGVAPIGTSGDTSKMGSPAISEAQAKVDAWVKDSCDNVTVHDVKAIDYGYEGLPKSIDAGLGAIALENTSTKGEMHEMALVRKNDGETKSFKELLTLPDDQAMEHVTIEGMVYAMPGQVGTGYADLSAGEYLAVCFIPQGASEAKPDGDGPPHFMLGMQQEFTVK